MVNKKTKKNLKLLLKECKEKPYLFPLYPLSALGFIFAGSVEPESVIGRVFYGNTKR
jgi:hypothetical protein